MIPIANNEVGSSVRAKLNTIISLVTEAMVVKTADETRNIYQVEDYDLLVAVEAGQSYLIELSIVYNQAGAGDNPSITWILPNVDSAEWFVEHIGGGAAPEIAYHIGALLPTEVPTTQVGINVFKGWLRLSPSEDGYVILVWGKTGAGGAPTVKAGSWSHLIPSTYAQS